MSVEPELLVPFDGTPGATEVMRHACRIVRRDRLALVVLCVALLRADDPSAWADTDLDTSAMEALARAQRVCHEEGVTGVFKLNHACDLATAIVAEARRSEATLICLTLNEGGPGEAGIVTDAVQTVLAAAPCSVLLRDPGGSPPLLPPGMPA